MSNITLTVTARHNVAAVMAAAFAAGNTDPQAWLQSVIDAACKSYRDQYRTDAIPSTAFIRRIPPSKYASILAASEQVPELAAYLARLDAEPLVWLGAAETQAGVGALVTMGLLTQAEADAVLTYSMPEPP